MSGVDSSTHDRCGYRLEIGLDDTELATEPCERPVWEDHGRCVWHAKVDGKTSETLEDARPRPDENLNGAYLHGASLVGVDWFADASMVGADLTDADVEGSDFSNADLMLATLTDVNAMNADFDGANLEGAILTNADLRRATLEHALLNEVVLTNAHIGGGTTFGESSVYEYESARTKLSDSHPLEAAAWTYRQLQQLYQANALPKLARRSYYQEKDTRRRLAWERGDYADGIRRELSRWVMRYGNSPYRILVTSFLVVTVAAVLFPLTGGIQESNSAITYSIDNPEDVPRWWLATVLYKSLYFSVITFATLGYGDIQPIGMTARMLAGVETVLGSLLSALLVFVLARRTTW